MNFKHDVTTLIKERKSTRTYNEEKLDDKTKKELLVLLEELNKNTKLRVRFVFMDLDPGEEKQQLGTYGFISGASQYVAALLDKSETDARSLGYLFEELVLFATDLGVQTCWLGGTFDKEAFGENAGVKENEYMPLVTPVGFKKDKQRIFETTMRKTIGADKRKPWKNLFYDGDQDEALLEEKAGDYRTVLEMVRLGPSASNKQPWRILKKENAYHLFLERNKGYGVGEYDIQMNDMGIAMCHFEWTAKELGLNGTWKQTEPAPAWDDKEYVITWIPS